VIEPKKKPTKTNKSMNYMKCLEKDLSFGETKEMQLKEPLEKHFGVSLNATPRNHPFDFVSLYKRLFIEIKTRRNTKSKYPSTMVGYNKVKFGMEKIKEKYDVFFVFSFTDKLCYYQLQEVNEEWVEKGGRFDRGRPEVNNYYYIPVSELTDIVV
jgi:hypothetical protein